MNPTTQRRERLARLLLPATGLLLVLALPGGASAFPRLGVELAPQWSLSRASSFDLVGEGDRWVALNPAIGVALTPRLGAWLTYAYGGSDAPLLSSSSAELTTHGGELSLVYQWPLTGWLQPFARVGAGLIAGRLELTLPQAEERRDWAWSPSYLLAGGLLVAPERTRGIALRSTGLFSETTFGLRLELGYRVLGGLGFDDLASSGAPDGGAGEIRRPSSDVGDVVLSGWTWRAALVALF